MAKLFARKSDQTISIDTGTMVRGVLIVIGAFLALSFIKAIASALIILFIAFFLALALNPAVSWISKRLKSKSRVRATGAAYILVLAFLIGFFSLVIPPLVKQTTDFIQEVPSTIQDFKNSDSAFSRFVYKNDLDKEVDRFTSDFASRFSDIGQPVLTTAGAVGSAVATSIAVLVLTFMMLVEGPSWFDKILATQSKSQRVKRRKLAYRMYRTVTSYVNGQLLLALIAGATAFIALIIGSSVFNASINEIALAGIVSLFALLPLIGTTLGAIIVVLACVIVSTPLAIAVAIYFVVYQQIENVTIQPYIQSRTNQLTPLIVFSSAIIGVTFAGILGALVAIPVAGCIKILLEEKYQNRIDQAENN
jgi:predicted PurR-regulated permease PerM